MADDLAALEDWAAPLLAKLEPSGRRALTGLIARELRRSQMQRVAAQRNPDGSAYETRKPQRRTVRGQQGKVRGKMFTKLRTAKFLRVRTDAAGATIGFIGRAERIARVHQFGLRDSVEKGGPNYTYAERELLGFTDAERERIKDLLLEHLGGS